MRISHRHRFIFFASPKTGSESMRALLDPLSDIRGVGYPQATPAFPWYSHMRPVEAEAAFARAGWPFAGYYRFVFVRNPWARMASLYAMIQRLGPHVPPSFGAFLQRARPDGIGGGGPDGHRWRKYGTYALAAFAGGADGRLLVDDVFRLEDAATVPERLRARGVPLPADAALPWINSSRERQSLAALYTPALIDLVAERYAAEIAEFGYSFPG